MSEEFRQIKNAMTDLALGPATLDGVLDALQDLHRLRVVHPAVAERELRATNRVEELEERITSMLRLHAEEYAPHIEALQAMNLTKAGANVLAAAVKHLSEHATPRETGWLIEWPENDQLPVRWWHPIHGWVRDANRATRYARQVDAEDAIKTSRFVTGSGGVRATEHSWSERAASHTSRASSSTAADRRAD